MLCTVYLMVALGMATATNWLQPQPIAGRNAKFVGADEIAKSLANYGVTKQTVAYTATVGLLPSTVVVNGVRMNLSQGISVTLAVDNEPTRTRMELSVVEVPTNFMEQVGLGDGVKWNLSAREAKMLHAVINSRVGKDVAIRSTTQVVTKENQSGYLHGESVPVEYQMRTLPRVSPQNGSIEVEFQALHPKRSTHNSGAVQMVSSFRSAMLVPKGDTYVYRASLPNKPHDVLILVKLDKAPSEK